MLSPASEVALSEAKQRVGGAGRGQGREGPGQGGAGAGRGRRLAQEHRGPGETQQSPRTPEDPSRGGHTLPCPAPPPLCMPPCPAPPRALHHPRGFFSPPRGHRARLTPWPAQAHPMPLTALQRSQPGGHFGVLDPKSPQSSSSRGPGGCGALAPIEKVPARDQSVPERAPEPSAAWGSRWDREGPAR